MERRNCTDGRTDDGKTRLHSAVEDGNIDAVQLLLQDGVDVEAITSETRQSALHLACNQGESEIALELLRHGGDAGSADADGTTPLEIAVVSNMVPVAKEMIALGVRLSGSASIELARHCESFKMRDMYNLLVSSDRDQQEVPRARAADVADRVARLSTGSVAAGILTESRKTRLHHVGAVGSLHPVEQPLLGDNPIKVDSWALSPLHSAAREGNVVEVDALLRAGSDLTARTQGGCTPLHMATQAGHTPTVRAILAASSRGSADLDSGQAEARTIDAQDAEGRCALHLAASQGNVEVLEVLLEAKAVVDCQDSEGRTPLHVAVSHGQVGAVTALARHGASLEMRDAMGNSPLFTAVQGGQQAVVAVLLDAGASASARVSGGETVLHEACRRMPGAIEALLRAGAHPGHCLNAKCQSPLHVACSAGQVEAVRRLLPLVSRRKKNMRDRIENGKEGGDTPLLTAIRNRHAEVVDLVSQTTVRGGSLPTGLVPKPWLFYEL